MEIFLSFMQMLANFIAGPFAVYVATVGLGLWLVSLIFMGRHAVDGAMWIVFGCVGLLGLHTLVTVFGV